MFTGLVEALGTVRETRQEASGRRLTIEEPSIAGGVGIGDSVAINGCCLTVVEHDQQAMVFEAGPETLKKTNLGQLVIGERVNLERSLAANGRLGGHIVQGHVDTMGTIERRERQGEWETIWFQAGSWTAQMVPKGSITVDGISLTLVDVIDGRFSVALIPHTLAVTTLGFKQVGAVVNLETDILGKYVLKYLTQMTSGLDLDKLRQAGFVE